MSRDAYELLLLAHAEYRGFGLFAMASRRFATSRSLVSMIGFWKIERRFASRDYGGHFSRRQACDARSPCRADAGHAAAADRRAPSCAAAGGGAFGAIFRRCHGYCLDFIISSRDFLILTDAHYSPSALLEDFV